MRGTEFSVRVAPDGATRVEVAAVSSGPRSGVIVDVNAGQGLDVDALQNTSRPMAIHPGAAIRPTLTPFGFAALPTSTPIAPVVAVVPTMTFTPFPTIPPMRPCPFADGSADADAAPDVTPLSDRDAFPTHPPQVAPVNTRQTAPMPSPAASRARSRLPPTETAARSFT